MAKKKKRLGNCYENSYWFLMERSKISYDEYHLVHGSVLARLKKGERRKRIPHAWTENLSCGSVWDVEWGYAGTKKTYYRFFKAKVHKSFTREEALRVGLEKGYFGEWD